MNKDIALKRLLLLQSISALGSVVELDFHFDAARFAKDIVPFENNWKKYNPRKPIPREGLSLTSLDGELCGVPDLDSLLEYNKTHGTSYDEDHFTKITPVYRAMTALGPVLDKFGPHLGRSHLIRFGKGGHFPPHRDTFGIGMSCFRVLGLCQNCGPEELVFMMGGERVHLQPGRFYFIETRRDHALFSFADDCIIFVLNVIINEESFRALMESVKIR